MQLAILAKLVEVIFPVFFIIGVGYWIGKKNPNFDTNFITSFSGSIGVPSMLFYSLTSTSLDFSVFFKFAMITALFVALFAVTGIVILLILKRNILMELPPLILPNTGNIGLPLCLFAYGASGFSIASSIAAMIMLFHFTIGIFLASGKLSFKPLATSVPMYAIVITGTILYFKIPVPQFIINTTMLIAYATIFLILTSLGIALTKLQAVNFKGNLAISLVRLISGPMIAFIIIRWLDLESYQAGALLIQCSMPSAVLTYLVAKMYSPKEHVDNIASVIVTSTTISLITIPIIVFIALNYFS
jgi:predicted permease